MIRITALTCLFLLFAQSLPAQKTKTKEIESTHVNTATPINTVRTFLEWYSHHYRELYQYQMTYADSAGNYRVNILDCTQYFEALKASGSISREYVRL